MPVFVKVRMCESSASRSVEKSTHLTDSSYSTSSTVNVPTVTMKPLLVSAMRDMVLVASRTMTSTTSMLSFSLSFPFSAPV